MDAQSHDVVVVGGLLSSLGCELDEAGFAIVDATGRTSTSGVWAAGNVVDRSAQVITSAGVEHHNTAGDPRSLGASDEDGPSTRAV